MVGVNIIFKRDKTKLNILLVPNTQKTGWIHVRKGILYLVSLLFSKDNSNSSCRRRACKQLKKPQNLWNSWKNHWQLSTTTQVSLGIGRSEKYAGCHSWQKALCHVFFSYFFMRELLAPPWYRWNHCHNSMSSISPMILFLWTKDKIEPVSETSGASAHQ